MLKRRNLIINRFAYKSNINVVQNLLNSFPYTDDVGYGFKNIEKDDKLLFITVIKRTPTFINYFNAKEGIFEKQQIFVFSELSIIIDFDLHTIYVNGSVATLSFVKAIFKNVLGDEFIVSSIDLTAYVLYEIIRKKKIKTKIEEISISDFSYEDGIIGRFSGKVIKQNVVASLMKQYKDDILKITFTIYFDDEDFLIQLANNGSIALSCDEDAFKENLLYLTNIIFK